MSLPFASHRSVGDLVFISGQAGIGTDGTAVSSTFAAQLHAAVDNLEQVLADAGCTLTDVVRVTAYVKRGEDLPEFNRLYRAYFAQPYPARTTLTGCLNNLLFEIDAIAVRPPSRPSLDEASDG